MKNSAQLKQCSGKLDSGQAFRDGPHQWGNYLGCTSSRDIKGHQ